MDAQQGRRRHKGPPRAFRLRHPKERHSLQEHERRLEEGRWKDRLHRGRERVREEKLIALEVVQEPTLEGVVAMVDILHKVGIQSSPDDAYKALTTREGLSAWWTNDTQGEGRLGGVLQFRFGTGGFDMKVLELDP